MDGNAIPHYPTRWLHTGDPFEFRTEPATPPPSELVSDFQKIVGDIGVLGLYFAGTSAGILELEWTEGRKNITKIVPEHVPGNLETAWLPGTKDPIQMKCQTVCDTTGQKHKPYHTGR